MTLVCARLASLGPRVRLPVVYRSLANGAELDGEARIMRIDIGSNTHVKELSSTRWYVAIRHCVG